MADHRVRSRKRNTVAVEETRRGRTGVVRQAEVATIVEPGVAGIRFPRWQWWAFCALILLFARYYYWTINPTSEPIREYGAYTFLGDAFYHHQTYLRQMPAPQLLALKDPYDPQQNARYRLHDASLYKGRYYYYFGPAPALLLYLPYAVILREPLSDRVGTWLFASAAYLMACFLLRLLVTRFWPHSPQWLFYFLCACLGFSNSFPFLLRRPEVYETAIVSGQFFALLGMYLIARVAFGPKRRLWMAALGGAALAAAFGSRPHMVFAVVALGWFLIPHEGAGLRRRLQRLAAGLGPFAAGAALLLYYNYRRFDSIFEFGNHYQLAAVNIRKLQFFSISRLFQNLWLSVLEPPRLRSTFPFVVLAPNPPFHVPRHLVEVVMGIVWIAPLVLLLLAAPIVWKKLEPARRIEWSIYVGTLVLLGGAWICMDGLLSTTMRYQADFATVLFLAAVLVIGGLVKAIPARFTPWFSRAIVILGLFGVLLNGAVGMTGYYDNFRVEAPAEYQSLAAWFQPVESLLARMGIPSRRIPYPKDPW